MSLEAMHVLAAILVGLGASRVMGLWKLFFRQAFGVPSLDNCLLGR